MVFYTRYMMHHKSLQTYLVILCTSLLWACTGSKHEPITADNGYDRAAMLTNIADEIILPSYAKFKGKLDLMVSQSDSFATKPSAESLVKLRQTWVDSYVEWQKVELFDVGPAEIYTLHSYLNIYPTSTTAIETNISTGTYNFGLPTSYPEQGFPALDYLINGLGATDDEILAKYTTAADAAKRISYLKAVVAQLNTRFVKIYTEWTTNNYRATFISKTNMDIYSSTSLLVNGYVLNYERYIRSGKFGIPSGAMLTDGTTAPEKVEAYYKKDLSLTLAKTAHQASLDLYNGTSALTGTQGPSLRKYLLALDAKDTKTGVSLVAEIDSQFVKVADRLNVLKPNLAEEVSTNNQAMINTFDEMQKLVRLLKVDMTSALSVTITYTDNDGD